MRIASRDCTTALGPVTAVARINLGALTRNSFRIRNKLLQRTTKLLDEISIGPQVYGAQYDAQSTNGKTLPVSCKHFGEYARQSGLEIQVETFGVF